MSRDRAERRDVDGGRMAGVLSVPEADSQPPGGGSASVRVGNGNGNGRGHDHGAGGAGGAEDMGARGGERTLLVSAGEATPNGSTHPHGATQAVTDGRELGVPRYARGKALVLNASMEPLCVVPSRRAVVLVLSGKADLLHDAGRRYRSERMEFPVPSVVRLRRYVRVPYRRRAPLSRRGVFIRDEHTCQYCGRAAENVDHVQPRSRGGAHAWENVAASCTRCNAKKKDRTPEEARMHLRRRPYAPSAAFWLVVAVGGVEPSWQAYLHDALTGS